MTRRAKINIRDAQDYESSRVDYLKFAKPLLRNYSAHFFRWSFARRLLKPEDDVLEIGCGVDCPAINVLLDGPCRRISSYHGVDLNPLRKTENQNVTLQGDFNFVERWKELWHEDKLLKFSVIMHLEVIEHMRVKFGKELLHGCHELLCKDGRMIMSTPVYDKIRHSKRHVHEYKIPEMNDMLAFAGFKVISRFGTYMDIKYLDRVEYAPIRITLDLLKNYFDNDALSCIFAPLFPDFSRNNLWVCEKI